MDVGLAEVLASEEERLADGLGEGVGETITEIKSGGMATFAVVGVALSCEESLLFGDRINRNSRVAEK